MSKGIFQTQRTRTYGTDEEKARDIASRLPAGGGTYKRFVFCVLGDDSAVRSAQLDWGWNRNLEAQPKDTSESTSGAGAEASRKEIADDEESDADDLDEMAEQLNGKLSPKKQRKEADMSPLELSRLHGLRMLSLYVSKFPML